MSTLTYAVFNEALAFVNCVLVAAEIIICLNGNDSVQPFHHFAHERHECFHHERAITYLKWFCTKNPMHILSALINKVLNQKLFYEAYNSVLSGEFTITISTGDKTDNVSLELLYQKLISLSTPYIFNIVFWIQASTL